MALRDFFLASGLAELEKALASMPEFADVAAEDIQDLEYEFNRLFIGPQPPLAPPYASVYLEKEPRLMGESTQRIARFYEALGLEVSIAGLPADFLALELEAWLAVQTLASQSTDTQKARQFLWQHLQSWLPQFTRRMRETSLSRIMAKIADLLDCWLECAKERIWQ